MADEHAKTPELAPPTQDERMTSALPAARWPLRMLIGLLSLVVVFGICEWMRWPFLRGPLESAIGNALKREVVIGPDFGLRLLGQLRANTDVFIIGPARDGPPIALQTPELLRAQSLRIAIPYGSLLQLMRDDSPDNSSAAQRDPVHITSLDAERLELTLLRDKDGRANWQSSVDAKPDARPLEIPSFGRLVVEKGELHIDDAISRLKLDAQLHTTDQAPAAGQSAADNPVRMLVDGKGSYRALPLTAKLRFDNLAMLVEDARGDAQALPVWLQLRVGSTELDFDGSARNLMQFGALRGRFRLAGPSLATVGESLGITLPTTAPFLMRGQVAKEARIWSAAISQLTVGSSRLNGNFRYDPAPAIPKLTGNLGGARLYMPDLGPAVGAPVAETTAADPPSGAKARTAATSNTPASATTRVLPQREFDIPSLRAMDADVSVAVGEFDLGTPQLEKLAPLQARILLDKQVLSLQDIKARTAKGDLRGMIAVDARQEVPRWQADLRWANVELERFVKARNVAEPGRTQGYISGALGGRARVSGAGKSMATVLGSLDGEMHMWVRGGQISHFLVEIVGLDIAQALGMLVRGDDTLPMQCAVATFSARKGEVDTGSAVIETTDSTVTGTGSISLRNETLALVLRARPKDISPMSLRTPVSINGSFAEPDVVLDKKSIGMRLTAAAALAAITPLAGLLALVDFGDEEKQACQQALDRLRSSTGKTASPPAAARP